MKFYRVYRWKIDDKTVTVHQRGIVTRKLTLFWSPADNEE